MVKSSIIEHQAGITLTITSINQSNALPRLDIAGSVAEGNQMTSPRKSHTCKGNTQTPKSSKTSAVGSTSIAKDLEPYWNESCEAINSALLLPIGIDSPDSGGKSYSSWSNKTVEKSWFLTNCSQPRGRAYFRSPLNTACLFPQNVWTPKIP